MRIARETYLIPNVVARIYDPRRAEIYQRLGIPTVATVTWTIDQVRRRLLPDEDVGRLVRPLGPAHAARPLPPRLVGRPAAVRPRRARVGSSVVAVTRSGVPRLDARELVGQEGDVLHLADHDQRPRTSSTPCLEPERPMRVAIAGAGQRRARPSPPTSSPTGTRCWSSSRTPIWWNGSGRPWT